MSPETQVLNNYISILEKTNQQLSLWSNPYGLMIGILTLLIAVIAIAVSYALWRYSKEQRDRINQFFIEQEKVIKEKNENVQKVEGKLNDLIKEYEKRLVSTKKNKKETQKIIDELKKEKAKVGAYMGPVTGAYGTISTISRPLKALTFSSYLDTEKSMICTQCGKNFSYYKDNDNYIIRSDSIFDTAYGTAFQNKDVYCTHCGTKNIPQ